MENDGYIAIGKHFLTPDSRYNLETLDGPEKVGATFSISDTSAADAGEYGCFIQNRQGKHIKFVLQEKGTSWKKCPNTFLLWIGEFQNTVCWERF